MTGAIVDRGLDAHTRVDWHQAACADTNPDLFFRPDGDLATYWRPVEAKRICATCPIRRDCGEWADQTGQVGIWGGIERVLRGNGIIHVTTATDRQREQERLNRLARLVGQQRHELDRIVEGALA